MKKYLFLLGLTFLMIPLCTFSQTNGCLRNGYIYYVLDAEGDYTNGYIQYEMNNYNERTTASGKCYQTIPNNSICYVDDNIGSASGWGTHVSYGPIYCSIDDKAWVLLAFVILPVYAYRRKIFKTS